MHPSPNIIIVCAVSAGLLAAMGLESSLLAVEPASDQNSSALARQFADPPDTARPWVWWHWIGGNINHPTITAELEDLKRNGAAGGIIYYVDSFPKDIFKDQKVCWSPEWVNDVVFATKEAKRIGVKVGFQYVSTSSGVGGPWIDVEHSGQTLVWSGVRVSGGGKLSVQMPQPEIKQGFYRDVAVVAYPAKGLSWDTMRLASPTITASSSEYFEVWNVDKIVDGDPGTYWSSLNRGPKGEFIELTFSVPYTANAIYLDPRPGFAPRTLEVRVSDDHKQWRSIAKQNLEGSKPWKIPLPETTGRYFQVLFPTSQSPDGRIGIQELRLLQKNEEVSRVDTACYPLFSELIGSARNTRPGWVEMFGLGDLAKAGRDADVDPAQAIDVTKFMNDKGVLTWNAPAGDWEILRFGRTSIGPQAIINCPPHGYHVDYLNPEAMKIHFEKGVDPLLKAVGDPKAFAYIQEDSFEVPFNRWTGAFVEEFQKRRGYDPTPWLPVLTGRIVGSQGQSERFLWDYRRTIADLYVTHWTEANRLSDERGIPYQAEAGGPVQYCMDALEQLGQCDVPMGEFWTGIWSAGVAEDDQPRGCWGDPFCETIRTVASAAHTYGKPVVSAESYTGYSRPYALAPFDVKAVGDRAYCDGVNRNFIHLCIAQTVTELNGKPVVARIHALDYNRGSTWWGISRVWMDYMARCCYLLQQGRTVADVAYFMGEGAPVYVSGPEFLDPKLPSGYNFDGCNGDVLLTARVENGRIVLACGASYALLVLPPAERSMTPALLRHLKDLVQEGAVVWGPKPEFSPSLSDAPKADQDIKTMAGEVWGEATTPEGEHAFGKGKVVWGKNLDDVLKGAGCPPAFSAGNQTNVIFTQRTLPDGGDIFFVANQGKTTIDFTGRFRDIGGKAPELWDASTGDTAPAPAYQTVDGAVEIPLHLAPRGSIFVVLKTPSANDHLASIEKNGAPAVLTTDYDIQKDAAGPVLNAWTAGPYDLKWASGKQSTINVGQVPAPIDLSHDWQVVFPKSAPQNWTNLTSWTESADDEIRCFSGTVTYRKTFAVTQAGKRMELDLGDLKNIAQVKLNGQSLGTLWKPPFRLDITSALHPGDNTLEVAVTNLLLNRIMGDWSLPPEKAHVLAYGTIDRYRQGASKDKLLPSGLFGPVRILSAAESPLGPASR